MRPAGQALGGWESEGGGESLILADRGLTADCRGGESLNLDSGTAAPANLPTRDLRIFLPSQFGHVVFSYSLNLSEFVFSPRNGKRSISTP